MNDDVKPVPRSEILAVFEIVLFVPTDDDDDLKCPIPLLRRNAFDASRKRGGSSEGGNDDGDIHFPGHQRMVAGGGRRPTEGCDLSPPVPSLISQRRK